MNSVQGSSVTDRLFIGGEWVESDGLPPLDVINPATEETVTQVAQAGISDVDRTVAAARRAFDEGPWPGMSAGERAARLRFVAGELRTRLPELASAITLEMGATLKTTTASCGVPPMLFDFYADLIENANPIETRRRPAGEAYTVMEPVGVVAAIVPWNAPLNLSALKVAPALAAGCSVILKAAPSTPLDALILAECLDPGIRLVILGRSLTAHPV